MNQLNNAHVPNETQINKELKNPRDLARLNDYLRLRLEKVESERVDWLHRIEAIRIEQDEKHKLEWELKKRVEEVQELQDALKKASLGVHEERKQIYSLTSELEATKFRADEDRRRLVQILQLAEPIEQTVKLYYDRRPEKTEKYANNNYDPTSLSLNKSTTLGCPNPKTSSSSLRNTAAKSASKKKLTHTNSVTGMGTKNKLKSDNNFFPLEHRIAPSDEKQQIVRTIVINGNNDKQSKETASEVELLKKQLFELKNFHENFVMRTEEERRLKDEETRLQILNYRDKVEELTTKTQKLEKLNYSITKDYMQLKFDAQTNEKKLYEAHEFLKCQNEALTISLQEISTRTNIDLASTKKEYEKKTKEIANMMRTQVKDKEENINIIKEQYKQVQKIYNTTVKELEAQLKTKTEKLKNSEQRRANDIQGYLNEISLIRKRMRSYEEYFYNLKNRIQGAAAEGDYDQINNEINENYDGFTSGAQNFKGEMDKFERQLNENYASGNMGGSQIDMNMSGRSGSNVMEEI